MIIFYFIFIIIIILYLIYKYYSKHHFWITQPIFLKYWVHYWFLPPGIINKSLPAKNKWYNHSVKTYNLKNIDEDLKHKFVLFVCNNYANNEFVKFIPSYNEVIPYFINNNYDSFFSFYYEKDLLNYDKKNIVINDEKIVGVISTRPLNFKINDTKIIVGYTDYLCFNEKYRNKHKTPELIFSHYYNVNKEVDFKQCFGFFKKEGVLNEKVIPLIKTDCFFFYIHDFNLHKEKMANLIKISKDTIYLLFIILKLKIKCMVIPDFSNLVELINTNNYIIYVLLYNNEVVAIYCFKNETTYYEEGSTVQCNSCINLTNDELFYNGFINCLTNLACTYDVLCIENLCDNNIILTNLLNNYEILYETDIAYYSYNFVHKPINCNDAFILT